MDFRFLLGAVPPWVADSFPTLQIIVISFLLALSLGLVIVILMQTSTSSGGVGAIGGQSTETFYSKNKGRTLQGLLKRLTIIFSIAILVLTVVYFVLINIYPVNV